eukprot:GDKK01045544.1.p1 GENE.GDKK01045544.1~~GDKK01045544.1.p1  ORF type:complete len:142 (-),score=9.43 GDKK01045544.1:78-503(-)
MLSSKASSGMASNGLFASKNAFQDPSFDFFAMDCFKAMNEELDKSVTNCERLVWGKVRGTTAGIESMESLLALVAVVLSKTSQSIEWICLPTASGMVQRICAKRSSKAAWSAWNKERVTRLWVMGEEAVDNCCLLQFCNRF